MDVHSHLFVSAIMQIPYLCHLTEPAHLPISEMHLRHCRENKVANPGELQKSKKSPTIQQGLSVFKPCS
jgi:hypothetical protein